jgi:hypothetical protein
MIMEEKFEDLTTNIILGNERYETPDTNNQQVGIAPPKPTFTKTGKSKKILGYNCAEYTQVLKDNETAESVVRNIYITNEIPLDESIFKSKLFTKEIMQKELMPT